MPKTPAERAREYRARKKLPKQEKPRAQTAAQRNRKYRARQKALRNAVATIGDNSSSTNFFGPSELPIVNTDNPQPSTSRDDGNILHKYLSQTSGQAEQAQVPVENTEGRIIVIHADVHQVNPSQSPMNPTSTTSTKTRKSVAQRCREYRQRKKMREDANTIVVQRPVVSSVIVNVPSNEVEDRSNAIRTQKKCKDIFKHDAETEIVLEPEADIEIKNEIDCLDDDDINKVTEIYEDISDQDSEPDAIFDFEAEMDMKTDIELTNDEYTTSGLNTSQINAPTLGFPNTIQSQICVTIRPNSSLNAPMLTSGEADGASGDNTISPPATTSDKSKKSVEKACKKSKIAVLPCPSDITNASDVENKERRVVIISPPSTSLNKSTQATIDTAKEEKMVISHPSPTAAKCKREKICIARSKITLDPSLIPSEVTGTESFNTKHSSHTSVPEDTTNGSKKRKITSLNEMYEIILKSISKRDDREEQIMGILHRLTVAVTRLADNVQRLEEVLTFFTND